MNKIVKLALLLLIPTLCHAQNLNYNGACTQGGVKVVTSGISSTTFVQSNPVGCGVSVYFHGSTTLAPIFLDAIGTPLGNPFIASTNGLFNFYVSPNGHYDITMRVGVTPMTTTTIPDITVGSGGSGTGVTSVTGGIGGGLSVSVANSTTTPNITVGADAVHYIPNIGDVSFWNTKVNRTGDTMTGALVLPGDPATALQAADKNYVDTGVATATGLANAAQSTANNALTVANAAQPIAQKGQTNGYASLDGTTRVPIAQLPTTIAYTNVANNFTAAQSFTTINASTSVTSPTVVGGPTGNIQMRAVPGSSQVSCLTMNGQCASSGTNGIGFLYNTTVPNDLVIAYGLTGHLTLVAGGTGGSPVTSIVLDQFGNEIAGGMVGGGQQLVVGGNTPGTITNAPNCGTGNVNCKTANGVFTTTFTATGGTGSVAVLNFSGYSQASSTLCLANGFTSAGAIAGIDTVVSGSSGTMTLTFNLINAAANVSGNTLTVKYMCTF